MAKYAPQSIYPCDSAAGAAVLSRDSQYRPIRADNPLFPKGKNAQVGFLSDFTWRAIVWEFRVMFKNIQFIPIPAKFKRRFATGDCPPESATDQFRSRRYCECVVASACCNQRTPSTGGFAFESQP